MKGPALVLAAGALLVGACGNDDEGDGGNGGGGGSDGEIPRG